MPSLRLMSLKGITSFNVTILSSQHGGRLQLKRLHYQKPAFRNERYTRKNICHGCEGQIESLVMPFSNPRDGFFYLTLTPMTDSYIPCQSYFP